MHLMLFIEKDVPHKYCSIHFKWFPQNVRAAMVSLVPNVSNLSPQSLDDSRGMLNQTSDAGTG